jgi:hypothetical protein
MTAREKLIQEINQSPDFVVEELLDFLLFIKSRRNQVLEEDTTKLSDFYGCIKDETFIRHPQPEQPEREAF